MELRARAVRDVVFFVSLYLLLSLPPFLVLNQEIFNEIAPVAVFATLGTVALVAVTGVFLAREGIERYSQFLQTPVDLLSIIIDSSFVLAAVSWWFIPELAFHFELESRIGLIVATIIVCHVPMVLFLSLMTSIGKVKQH